jgi:hypothetical protein
LVALLAISPDRKRPGTVVTGPAKFSLPEGFHGQGVIHVGTSLFFLKQGVMALAAFHSRRFMLTMIEHHGSETFGILEHDVSAITLRLNRRPIPQQTGRNEYRQTENPYSKCHRIPFQNDDPFEIDTIISRSRSPREE